MEKLTQFLDLMQAEPAVCLATAGSDGVSMRVISPVSYQGGLLFFTEPDSRKYRQLQENPRCCIGTGTQFAECTAALLGATLLPEHQALRDAYCAKFPGAFDEGIEFGGRTSHFVLLTVRRLSGWVYPDGAPAEGIPTIPFSEQISE